MAAIRGFLLGPGKKCEMFSPICLKRLKEIENCRPPQEVQIDNLKKTRRQKMAKFDVVTFKDKQSLCLNLDDSVGAGGTNKSNDVALIQAMLIYLAPFDFAGSPTTVIPELTGDFDTKTGDAIRNFQKEYAVRLMQIDGIVHEAYYTNRNIKDSFSPLMTITYLHILCKHAAKLYAHRRYPEGITMMFPQLLPRLRYPDLRTLYWLS